jgi:hypothetical protein
MFPPQNYVDSECRPINVWLDKASIRIVSRPFKRIKVKLASPVKMETR